MKKYSSKSAIFDKGSGELLEYYEPDHPQVVGRVVFPHIIFNNEDGKCGIKVSFEEIVDVWLETLEPEQQQKLELEQKTEVK